MGYATGSMLGLLYLFAIAAVLITVVGAVALVYGLAHPFRKTLAVAVARQLAADPSELGLAYQERRFTLADGSMSPGWVIEGRAAGSAAGPVVVFAHGFGDSRFGALTWVPQVVDFASRVVVYDLRAHGDSSARISRTGMADVDDLLAVVDQLDVPDRVVLFGHSLGAGVSIVAAGRGHSNIVGVIADGPYRYWWEPIVGLMRQKRWPAYPFIWLAGLGLMAMGVRLGRFDRVRHAAKVSCPLLVLHAMDDPLCRAESARQIVEAAGQGKLIEFDGGGHGGLCAHDPDRYRQALAEFFESLTPPVQVGDHAPFGASLNGRSAGWRE